MRSTHLLLAIMVTAIWGTNFVLIRIGLDELPPFTFATLRFLIVAIPLVFLLPKPAVDWWHLISFGVFIGFGQFGVMFWAMQDNISPGLASLVVQVQVFFTILMSALLFAERIHQLQWLALTISATGVLLIAAFTDGTTTVLGLLLIIFAAFSWSCGNLVVKVAGQFNMLAFMAWSSLFAALPLGLMALYLEGSELMQRSVSNASLTTWAVVLWQSVGNTIIGYGLWNTLLQRYPAATVTPWALLVPVFGISASAGWLGEPLTWWKTLAAFLIVGGLLLNIQSGKFATRTQYTALKRRNL